MTEVVVVHSAKDPALKKIASDLKKGKLVVFPTETVYGLGANALDEKAVRKIFKAKNRPQDNPLLVHVSSFKMLKPLVKKFPPIAKKLMKHFWPGALTLVFEKTDAVPSAVTAGLPTVGIRFPSHPVARKLIALSGVPLAAPSANTATKPSTSRAEHAFHDLNGKVDWIIDSGATDSGVESTILDITRTPAVLLRPGAVTKERLERCTGKITVPVPSRTTRSKPLAPGMKYRHYSPNAKVWLVSSQKLEQIAQQQSRTQKTAVISYSQKIVFTGKQFRFHSLKKLAQELFHTFRVCDAEKTELILVETVSSNGIGLALQNRLNKAAEKIVK